MMWFTCDLLRCVLGRCSIASSIHSRDSSRCHCCSLWGLSFFSVIGC